MTKKERNSLDSICGSDMYRLIRKTLKDNGRKDIPVDVIKLVIETYTSILYACLLNNLRVTLPNIGEFYRDKIKGRKAGYYKVPKFKR